MLKPVEQIICIIPPCSGGRKQTFKDFLFLFFLFYLLFTAALIYIFASFTLENILTAYASIGIFLGLSAIFTYGKFRITYIELAEKIFTILGWQNVQYINLRKMTEQHINELIKQDRYSLKWIEFQDSWIRPAKNKSKTVIGLYYYQPEVVFKKTKNSKSKSN